MRLIKITQVELQPRSTAGASLKETERWVNPDEVKELRRTTLHDPYRSDSGSDTKGIDHAVLALRLNGEEIFIKDEPLEEMASTIMGPQEDIFEQIQQAVIAWFAAHPVRNGDDGEPGPGPTPEEIAFAIAAYIQANPPQRGLPGENATVEQIAIAVAAYFGEHPIPAPIPGTNGREIELQRTTDFIQWRYRGDPAWTNLVALTAVKGDKGDAGKSVSIRVSNGVIQWQNVGDAGWVDIATLASLKGNTGANIELQATTTAIQWRVVGASTWIDLVLLSALKGAQGPAGQTFLAQINVTDTATLAITLGVVDMRFGCPGAIVGERYLAFVRSYKLNGAASATPGRPAGYYVVAVDCMVADTINIAHMRPAIALGSKYELFTDIVKVNAT